MSAFQTDLFAGGNDPDGDRDQVLDLWCLGRTKTGYPIHPMARGRHRVPDSALPQPFGRQPGTFQDFDPLPAPPTQMELPHER